MRYKKLSFKNDRMITPLMRRRAVKWLTDEFVKGYKGKASANGTGTPEAAQEAARLQLHVKRRKTSAASFFADSDSDDKEEEDDVEEVPRDELEAYLELAQVKCETEQGALNWWRDHTKEFPNLAVMARQYLGCPASSAAVERLFSQVGIAFSAKRRRAETDTLVDQMFARFNLP